MAAPTPKEGLDIVKKWEGWHRALPDGRAAPYRCPAAVITICYGATYWLDGSKIKMTDAPVDRATGEALLLKQLEMYAACVDRTIKVPMSDEMRSSCISLCYNIGTAAFAKSTVARRINAREWKLVTKAFKLYRMGGGRVLAGLENRRADEAVLFMRGVAAQRAPAPSTVPQVPLPPQAVAATIGARPGFWERLAGAILAGGPQPHPA